MRNIIVVIIILLHTYLVYGKNRFLPENVYLVSDNNVNVMEKPDIKSRIITKLNIADRVKLISKSGKKYESNNIKGEWVYIDTKKNKNYKDDETYKGWIIDIYLVGDEQFKIVNKFYKLKLEGYYGDYYIYYEINKDGSYLQKYYDMYLDKEKKSMKFYSGHLYQYRNIYITRSILGVEVLYVLNDKLCIAYTNVCTRIE
ncbi:MAG: hypothetical protein WBK20_06305 [Spirochaetota bacterium]